MPHTNRFQLANQFEFTLFITLTTFIRQMAPCCCVGREPEKNVALHGKIISFGIQLAQEGLFLKQFKIDL